MTLALLVPSLSVTVRRLHDTGRSGWWLLIALVFLVQDGEAGANRFGASPKAVIPGRSFQATAPGKPSSAPQAKR